jgi:prophage regulatory protein
MTDKNSPIVRTKDAMAYSGLRKSQFYHAIEHGEFPKPIKITDSGRATAWLRSELDAWLASRVAARDAK